MNSYGRFFQVTLYGESHQDAIGVVIDGMPSGILIDESKIKADLVKRQPGAIGTTPRKEADEFRITSGVFNGYSTGSPIHLMIENKNIQSKDYEHLKKHPRPGHADFAANVKYRGFQDYRGGGRFSGRLTAALVAAGAIAKMIIPFELSHKLLQVGNLTDLTLIDEYLEEVSKLGDSVGGLIEVKATNMIVGLGEPFFNKLDSEIGKMMFSIPAVKGVEIGVGFDCLLMKGSTYNDEIIDVQGKTKTNHSGGVTGGLSNGNDLVVKVVIKPTSSIQKEQETFNFDTGKIESLEIGGRHDVCIARRVGIVLENALAIVLADLYLIQKSYITK
ncbi:chorismate synthase [Peloplasma aerotolerans]|uniref:Chorismate synthase n=1 Tax=Peloplasma aerotolerans TaxID=3044389 RepID=A0AAW6UAK0_9MOLU|nr:chorismate synthase [Mariniplasma sp. M4Ah]MDI6452679.1 chorismate synthase [Mariniplasma sp. M4Ah]